MEILGCSLTLHSDFAQCAGIARRAGGEAHVLSWVVCRHVVQNECARAVWVLNDDVMRIRFHSTPVCLWNRNRITLLLRRPQEGKHLRFGSLPLYQVTCGLGAPVTLQASFTVCPSSAVQSVNTASKSGGPVIKVKCYILGIWFIFIVLFKNMTLYLGELISLKGIIQISVINYSPSCRFKPIRPSFILGTQIKIFWIESESSLTLHRQQYYHDQCTETEQGHR